MPVRLYDKDGEYVTYPGADYKIDGEFVTFFDNGGRKLNSARLDNCSEIIITHV